MMMKKYFYYQKEREEKKNMSNCKIIDDAMAKTKTRQWQVAELLGISENTAYRWFRKELPEDRQKEIAKIIYDNSRKRGRK